MEVINTIKRLVPPRSISMGENMETSTSRVKIGGCEGPEAMYVKLISADDHEFFIKRETALASGTIKVRLSNVKALPVTVTIFGHV